MVEFMNQYRPPMERDPAMTNDISVVKQPNIEEPIIPISELGTTAIDVSQQGHILQNLDKSIRLGTRKIQLIISGGGQGSPSSLSSSYGKDIREQVREKATSTGIELTGVELSPQRVSGLAGFNPQQGSITEEQRQNDLREVKYAIKFAADVADGGGVDVWSQEFNRNIFDAEWNNGGPGPNGKMFFDNNQEELENINKAQITKYLVDARSGQMVRDSMIRTNDTQWYVQYLKAKDIGLEGKKDSSGRVLRPDDYVDLEGDYVNRYDPDHVGRLVPQFDENSHQLKMERYDWDRIVKETEEYNTYYRTQNQPELRPEEWAYRLKLLTNIANTRGHAHYYHRTVDLDYQHLKEQVEEKNFIKNLEKDMSPDEKKRWVEDRIQQMERRGMGGQRGFPTEEKARLMNMEPSQLLEEEMNRKKIEIQGWQELVTTYRQQEQELREMWKHVKAPEKYAKNKTFDSYAQAGVYAYDVTKEKKTKKPLYVGPEIGFAGQSYGGHPNEFIEIVKESRKKMAERLMQEKGLNAQAAHKTAKTHIKGMLDTAHLTMWYKHFVRKPGESEEQRLKRFNKWTQDQVRRMVKEDVVGGIQIVDSITGEHSHLPPGQGKFDTVEMIKAMKEEGWEGPIVSEGHEEDQYTQGRILTETWKAFGSPITSVAPGQRAGQATWQGVHEGYFGYRMPHTYVVGGYSPSNEWQLWSEIPFE